MIDSSSNRTFGTRAALALLSCTLGFSACSSQSQTDAQAGAKGMPSAGGTSLAGNSGGGSGGAGNGGAIGFAGIGGASTGIGGAGGLGGSTANGGSTASGGNAGNSGSAVATDCAATCAAQTALSCTNGSDCQADCLAPADTTSPGVKCQAEYTAMIHCDAPLTAPQWMCSQDAAPVPVADQCTSTVCAYACCVGALVADQDLWSRCMPTCN